ncbi:MAG: cobalamin biosynthesis protein [Mobilicoccus sp.]|nr:cobalamin biosynthesis protein [Mobilicoccus sp.]
MTGTTRAAGLALGYLADVLLGDPRRGHPVAAFGTLATGLHKRLHRDSRIAGVAYVTALVGGVTILGVVVDRATRPHPLAHTVTTAVATWAVLGGTSLAREGDTMTQLLDDAARDGDLIPARARLSHLCSRDATDLDAAELARAAVESLAENTSDAVTAPLLWGALAGVLGLLGYRAANTLDAMVGYRTPELERFGWAAARFDDLLNLAPARLTALITVSAAPLVGGRSSDAWRAWRRDAPAHPSPNAGPVEASAAGALGVRLGGSNSYAGAVEDRGTLGDGPAPGVADLPRAVRLTRVVGLGALGVSVLAALAIGARR